MLARELARRDLDLGHLARRAFEGAIWRRLGYGSFEQYVRERVGLSASSVSARIALSRRVGGLSAVEEALIAGHIGFEAAGLVARVASPRTEAAWCERAARTTVKLLREEVEAVELVARVEGRDFGTLAQRIRGHRAILAGARAHVCRDIRVWIVRILPRRRGGAGMAGRDRHGPGGWRVCRCLSARSLVLSFANLRIEKRDSSPYPISQ